MKVTLIDFTGKGTPKPARYAAQLLVFTKSTRLQMTPSLMNDIDNLEDEKLLQELRYIAGTIPSSWEFLDYTFLIEDVSRGFTHQLVRTRTASFAQQTMRVLDVSQGMGWSYHTGPTITPAADLVRAATTEEFSRSRIYHDAMEAIALAYKRAIAAGAAVEDARGVLPTNILTNIVMKINMRNFVEMVRKRSSGRVQGEYRDVLAAMKAAVLEVHPFISLFIERTFDKAAADMDSEIASMSDRDQATRMLKLLDQLRSQS